jgi:hypothetical protein
MRPLFRFFGSKWTLAPHYPPPRFPVIVEPFAGGAGYSTRYHRRQVVLVERDPKIAELWRWLIAAKPDDIRDLPLLEPGDSIPDHITGAPRSLIGFWCATSSAHPENGSLSRRAVSSRVFSYWCARIRSRVADSVGAIKHWTLIEGDYSDAPDVEATWFIDPPYQGAGRFYTHGSGAIDFSALSRWSRTRRGQVMVCENVGADWMPFRPFRVGHAATRGSVARNTHEAIWSNEPDRQTTMFPAACGAKGE